ncbi:23S rRNA (adenine(1618)-N(6))-methyltransferase RlmF [Falsirhodobacter halotolerans]|uniref:23S rRNA (adenine(1618)-N(6))-methyltransferase RlmF n=1 Tax=Falsirhodobacter halotolerans TaxID=1146892 RepID=UPI001FD4BC63|nr:23S rRNA (adenine(1618)-N(6))-methyltransferase RlmF [Falsirhodobacter halotolerans]MCJ8140894.1 23S rRNA (adenine(1618)-N(6))-methyltransferase RlmF [Falsirhodobacter halotolerans]
MAVPPRLHPRNPHRAGYDFALLTARTPELAGFVTRNPRGRMTIDFADAAAVRALNRALLRAHYGVEVWDIPPAYLCPPIPGRADYIHHLADLLAEGNGGEIPRGPDIRVLDIGTGASLVYPLIGRHDYGWDFTGVDVDPVSLASARAICAANDLPITLRHQPDPEDIFRGVVGPKDIFHLTLCNPPFHASPEQADRGSRRKWRNLGKGDTGDLNFGGQQAELWCPGGEIGFVARMIDQSVEVADQCLWFTSLVSRGDSLKPLSRRLARTGVAETRIVDMAQGQKTSRFLAWTFHPKGARAP